MQKNSSEGSSATSDYDALANNYSWTNSSICFLFFGLLAILVIFVSTAVACIRWHVVSRKRHRESMLAPYSNERAPRFQPDFNRHSALYDTRSLASSHSITDEVIHSQTYNNHSTGCAPLQQASEICSPSNNIERRRQKWKVYSPFCRPIKTRRRKRRSSISQFPPPQTTQISSLYPDLSWYVYQNPITSEEMRKPGATNVSNIMQFECQPTPVVEPLVRESVVHKEEIFVSPWLQSSHSRSIMKKCFSGNDPFHARSPSDRINRLHSTDSEIPTIPENEVASFGQSSFRRLSQVLRQAAQRIRSFTSRQLDENSAPQDLDVENLSTETTTSSYTFLQNFRRRQFLSTSSSIFGNNPLSLQQIFFNYSLNRLSTRLSRKPEKSRNSVMEVGHINLADATQMVDSESGDNDHFLRSLESDSLCNIKPPNSSISLSSDLAFGEKVTVRFCGPTSTRIFPHIHQPGVSRNATSMLAGDLGLVDAYEDWREKLSYQNLRLPSGCETIGLAWRCMDKKSNKYQSTLLASSNLSGVHVADTFTAQLPTFDRTSVSTDKRFTTLPKIFSDESSDKFQDSTITVSPTESTSEPNFSHQLDNCLEHIVSKEHGSSQILPVGPTAFPQTNPPNRVEKISGDNFGSENSSLLPLSSCELMCNYDFSSTDSEFCDVGDSSVSVPVDSKYQHSIHIEKFLPAEKFDSTSSDTGTVSLATSETEMLSTREISVTFTPVANDPRVESAALSSCKTRFPLLRSAHSMSFDSRLSDRRSVSTTHLSVFHSPTHDNKAPEPSRPIDGLATWVTAESSHSLLSA